MPFFLYVFNFSDRALQAFLALKLSVRPAQWFEFDMPALHQRQKM